MIYWLSTGDQELIRRDPEKVIHENSAPDSSDAYFLLAAAYDQLEDKARARHFCRKALELGLAHIPSLYALASLHLRDRRPLEAARYINRAIRMDACASESIRHLQTYLRSKLSLSEALHWGLWCFELLSARSKLDDRAQYEFGKLLFESSQFERALEVLMPLAGSEAYGSEVVQYLSYLLERLYTGDELIEKTLELALYSKDRADLFFNLGMICQNEPARLALSIHFFYLASREDLKDPGLRFSLEQACLEVIGKHSQPRKASDFLDLMMAHLYHGSHSVAQRYAEALQSRFSWSFPQSFEVLQPVSLWKGWLSQDQGLLGQALSTWFGQAPSRQWKFSRLAQD